MTYFEEEWLCAYLESMEGNADKRGKAFSEVKALGYQIAPIDINHADKNWTILEGKKFMPSFFSCKGVGATAVEEIIQNRPYRTIYDIFWNEDGSWKLSKFNKRAVDSLIKIRGLDSMGIVGPGKTFQSYHQMYETIIPNWNAIRKSLKRNKFEGQQNFQNALKENEHWEPWTKREIIDNEMNLLGSVNVETIVRVEHLNEFHEKGWKPIEEYNYPSPYWFIVVESTVRKTKKGSPYLRCKVMGSNGKHEWLNVWSWRAANLPPYAVCVGEISANDFGKSCRGQRLEIWDS